MKRVSYLGQVDLAIDAVKKPRFLPVVKRLADQLIQHTRQTGFRGRGAPVVGGVDFAAVVLRWSGGSTCIRGGYKWRRTRIRHARPCARSRMFERGEFWQRYQIC